MARHTDATDDQLPKGKTFTLEEIGENEGVERVTENDIVKAADSAIFMNEMVTINVHPSGDQGALDVICPAVNGINQPIVRGKDQKVKRKYVECLARCRITKYDQAVNDPSRPESIQTIERTVLTYPFTVINDPNPRGRDWLQNILRQP